MTPRTFAEFAREMDADSDAKWTAWHDKLQAAYVRNDAAPSPDMEKAARVLAKAAQEATVRLALPGDPVEDIAENLAQSALRRAIYQLKQEES